MSRLFLARRCCIVLHLLLFSWIAGWTTAAERPKPLKTLLAGDDNGVRAVAFSPDSRTLATAHDGGKITLWDVATAQPKGSLSGHRRLIWRLAFSPDGKLLASGGRDGSVRLWEVAAGRQLALLQGHSGEVLCVSFSPDGKTLASGSNDGTVRIWDVQCRGHLATVGRSREVDGVNFSPDGRFLVSCGMGAPIQFWNVATHELAKELDQDTNFVNKVIFAPDGKTFCADSQVGGVELWEAEPAKRLVCFKGHESRVHCLAMSPDGRFLVSSSSDPPWWCGSWLAG